MRTDKPFESFHPKAEEVDSVPEDPIPNFPRPMVISAEDAVPAGPTENLKIDARSSAQFRGRGESTHDDPGAFMG
jgi:hypothetical protein